MPVTVLGAEVPAWHWEGRIPVPPALTISWERDSLEAERAKGRGADALWRLVP